MKAPEKIYLFENPISGTPDDRWLTKRSCDADIEYTRTDAFIEKACEWLDDNLINYWSEINANNTKQFIEEFKKAMEE